MKKEPPNRAAPLCSLGTAYLRLRVLFLFAGALPRPPRAVVFLRPVVLRPVALRAVVFFPPARAVVFFRPVVFLRPVALRPALLDAVLFFRPPEVVFLRPAPPVV